MTIRKLSFLTGLAVALLVPAQLLASPPPDSQKKVDHAIRKILTAKKGGGSKRVIIQFEPKDESKLLSMVKGKGTILAQHRLLHAFTVKVNDNDLEAIAGSPFVKWMSLDSQVVSAQVTAPAFVGGVPVVDDALRASLGLTATSLTGSTVGVAVIDSGIADSAEFAGRITAFYDFTKGDPEPTNPYDDYGHGTHVAGLIAGSGALSNGQYQGVAPGARLIGLKVLDAQGGGYSSSVMQALEFAIAHKADLGIDVINMSLGHPPLESVDTDPMVLEVQNAVAAGITVVISAGNIGVNATTGAVGYGGITSPGNAPGAITIGAADTKETPQPYDDEIAIYSSRGPTWYDGHAKPDVVAPGHRLVSATTPDATLYQKHPSLIVNASGGDYLRLCGTSMAAGVASGVVALVIDAHRAAHPNDAQFTPNTIKGIVEYTAIRLNGFDRLTQGVGEMNAAGAMQLASALVLNGNGKPHLAGPVDAYTVYDGYPAPWVGQISWGTKVVSGQDIVWGDSNLDDIVWGEDIVWGDEAVQAQCDDIVWGECDDIVWGESNVWGDDIVWGEDIVWSEAAVDDIVWGELSDIVWGECDDIVWGEAVLWSDGQVPIVGVTASKGGSL